MFEGVWNAVSNGASKIGGGLSGAWDYLNTTEDQRKLMAKINESENVSDEDLMALADLENEIASGTNDQTTPLQGFSKALGNIASASGQSQQTQTSGGGRVGGGGGGNIQVEDQYAAAMKALVEKYGHLMFNKDF